MIHPDIERVALLGWHLYPASARSKAACIKNPTWGATADLDQIARWSHAFPRCNWRVVFGPSRLWGLDCDVPPGHAHDGVAGLKALVAVHGPLPPRPTARSGGGGLGLFFRHDGERIIGEGGHPAPGIDPRRGQQSQTIPPSIHHRTKAPYRWLVAPWEVAPPPAPAWLLRLVEPPPVPAYARRGADTTDQARRMLYRACGAVAMAAEGHRNDALNRRAYLAGRLIAAGRLDEREAAEQLYGAGRAAGLDHVEIVATIKSGIRSGSRRPWEDTSR